jgi:hypothetical protein
VWGVLPRTHREGLWSGGAAGRNLLLLLVRLAVFIGGRVLEAVDPPGPCLFSPVDLLISDGRALAF